MFFSGRSILGSGLVLFSLEETTVLRTMKGSKQTVTRAKIAVKILKKIKINRRLVPGIPKNMGSLVHLALLSFLGCSDLRCTPTVCPS